MHSCDILVIGGGTGVIDAAAKASADAEVTVLETEAAYGYHATGRSAANFALNYGHSTLRSLNAASPDLLQTPGAPADASFRSPRGALQIATEAQAPMRAASVIAAMAPGRFDAPARGEYP